MSDMRKSAIYLLALLSPIDAAAQIPAMQFLEIPASPKAAAMGEAYVALSDDPFGLFWNPAGMEKQALAVNYTKYIQDIDQTQAAFILPKGKLTFGFGVLSASMKPEPIYDSNGAETSEEMRYSGTAGEVAAAFHLTDALSFGLSYKRATEKIPGFSMQADGLDFGLKMSFWNRVKLGASVQNNGKVARDSVNSGESYKLPTVTRGGLAYAGKDFTLSAEARKTWEKLEYSVGMEYWFWDTFALRAGYRPAIDFGGLSTGLAYKTRSMQIDTAWSAYGELGNVYQLGLTYRFPWDNPEADSVVSKPEPPVVAPAEVGLKTMENEGQLIFEEDAGPIVGKSTVTATRAPVLRKTALNVQKSDQSASANAKAQPQTAENLINTAEVEKPSTPVGNTAVIVDSANDGAVVGLSKYFADLDIVLPGNVAVGAESDMKALVQGMVDAGADSGSYSLKTAPALGARIGYALTNGIGVSLGYIAGPNSTGKMSFSSTLLGDAESKIDRKVSFTRILAEYRKSIPLEDGWSFTPGFGFGWAFGSSKETTYGCTNWLVGTEDVATKKWGGFTWELSPIFSRKYGSLDLSLAVRYVGFPKLKENIAVSKIDWSGLGFSIGIGF